MIGLGNVGRIVAERAIGLRMKVLGYDPFCSAENMARMEVEPATLEEIFSKADFITVHVPLTPETQGLDEDERSFRQNENRRCASLTARAAASSMKRI